MEAVGAVGWEEDHLREVDPICPNLDYLPNTSTNNFSSPNRDDEVVEVATAGSHGIKWVAVEG